MVVGTLAPGRPEPFDPFGIAGGVVVVVGLMVVVVPLGAVDPVGTLVPCLAALVTAGDCTRGVGAPDAVTATAATSSSGNRPSPARPRNFDTLVRPPPRIRARFDAAARHPEARRSCCASVVHRLFGGCQLGRSVVRPARAFRVSWVSPVGIRRRRTTRTAAEQIPCFNQIWAVRRQCRRSPLVTERGRQPGAPWSVTTALGVALHPASSWPVNGLFEPATLRGTTVRLVPRSLAIFLATLVR